MLKYISPKKSMWVAAVCGLFMAPFGQCETSSPAQHVVVASVKGEASLIREGQSTAIKAGDQVREGDQIRTAADGTVDLVVNNVAGYRALPSSESSVKNADPRSTDLSVTKGKIVVNLSKLSKDSSFQVTTPTAIAAVRGTQFSCSANPGDGGASFAVREGVVEVKTFGTGESVMLSEGFALDIPPNFSGALNPREAQGMELAVLDQASSIKTCS